jgi:hypothetical protein
MPIISVVCRRAGWGGRVGRSIGRRRVSIVAALSVGAGTLGGALGGHVSSRLTWSLAAFAATLLTGMGCAYYLDRRSRADEGSPALPDGSPIIDDGAVGGGPSQLIAHASAPAAMPATGSDRTQPKEDWVAAVMAFSDIQKPDFRGLLLTKMGDALGLRAPFAATYSAMASDHVTEIVNSCCGYEDDGKALRALAETLIKLRPNTSAAANLRRMLRDGL